MKESSQMGRRRASRSARDAAASNGLQVTAGLFPSASQVPDDWTYSSMRLVMTAGTNVLTRGSAQGPLNAALQAFLTDTLKAEGIAATKGALELCGAGVALTGSIAAIDQVEQVFAGVTPADDMQVRHSVELAGPWSSPNYRAYQRSAGKGRWVPADRSCGSSITPKSDASVRNVVLPELIIPELVRHLETFAGPGQGPLRVRGGRGRPAATSTFPSRGLRALVKAGLPTGTYVHDLRYTGNTLSAEAGASLPELMSRVGHSSGSAAMVYLHARDDRDRQLAGYLDRKARREVKRSADKTDSRRSGATRTPSHSELADVERHGLGLREPP